MACGWPYVNYLPHLGTVVQVLSADVVARYYRLIGKDVVMVSGSDEHGTPIEVEAVRQGVSPKQLTDKNHAKVVELFNKWHFSFNNYTRTENRVHKKFVQDHLAKIYRNGYISVMDTEMLYCEECRRFLPDRFVEGRCPYCGYETARGDQCESCGRLLEPTLLIEPHCEICKSKPAVQRTKHWYFDLPKFEKKLNDYIQGNKQLPNSVKNFSLNFIREGLKPRAITRDVEWGISAPFPGAEGKTVYVWIEAVLGYLSATIEYFENSESPDKWKKYWVNTETETLFFIGKDNIPFHTIILPALLLASEEDYNLPSDVLATEFLQFKGEAFSKSRRIGIYADEALEMFPADYWRYFLMAIRPESRDTNFSWELFIEKVNSDLNDTLGNFIHRTLMFINTRLNGKVPKPRARLAEDEKHILKVLEDNVGRIAEEIGEYRLQAAVNDVIGISRVGNQWLNEKEPWKTLEKNREEAANTMYVAVQFVKALAVVSCPFVPSVAEKLWRTLKLPGSVHEQRWEEALKRLSPDHRIAETEPLFRKIDAGGEKLENMLTKIRQDLSRTD